MNQTPESNLNIGPALTPQVLPSPTEPPIIKEEVKAPEPMAIKPELTIPPAPTPVITPTPTPEPAPAPTVIPPAPAQEIYPPLEVNPPLSIPTPVPAPITPLPEQDINNDDQTKPMTLEEHLNIVRSNLYVTELTPEIEDLIIKYVNAYRTTLDYCLKTPMPEEEKVKELELLSGPINEIYNPNNSKLFDGNSYPAVELILNKVDEYAEGLEKGFSRVRMPANASASHDEENQPVLNTFGYLSVLFIFIATVVFSIALGYLLFILKK